MQPAVSIIMPVYNSEAFLAEAVQSVLDQDFSDFELLVIDDGSPGDVPAVLSQFDDPRIKYLRHENRGQAYSRNRGIRASSGRYIAFLDSDDAWMPDKLSRQVALLDAQPEYDVVCTQRQNMDAQSRPISGYTSQQHSGFVLDELYVNNFVCMSSAIVRRTVFDDCGYMPEHLRTTEDYAFWLRVACNHRFKAIDMPLVRYRMYDGQVSRRIDDRMQETQVIYREFNQPYGHLVSRRARLRSRALHFAGRALRAENEGHRWQAFKLNLCALAYDPFGSVAWRGLVKSLLPKPVLMLVRKALKRDGAV